jgi:NAD(P)H-quinone oxidoreductase subunit 5
MITPWLWLLLAGPLCLAIVGLLPTATANAMPMVVANRARWAALGTLATAIAMAVHTAVAGPVHTPALPGIGLWFDSLTAVMFLLVAFVGVIVIHYSRNYLAGDANHGRFTSLLCLTLASVLTVIISGNLIQFLIAWVATSLSLGRLLVFYRDRPAAILAERKKFIASRIGDLCIAIAIGMLWQVFGGLDYATLFDGARAMAAVGGATPPAVQVAAFLLAIAALLKSAQFPMHGWLIEVMETPTPVSALLHAGIINAGGFLLLRFSGVMGLSTGSLDLLALVGGFTALFASVVMLTQSSIKVSLAWSTIAQMGFMMLQCGLGAWSAALLHIVAHSLYKAHAFLSSGSVIDIARASWSPSPGGQPHPARMGIAVGLVLAVTLLVSTVFGATIAQQPGVFALGAIMLLGLTHLIAQAIDERPNSFVILRTLALAGAVAVAYFGLNWAVVRLAGAALPAVAPLRGPLTLVIVVLVVGAFAAVTILQSTLARASHTPRWQALHVHIANGLYVNTIANRLVLRLWPTGR